MADAENASTNATNGTIPFEFHESLMAYSGLYLMAIFCIVLGSCRSVEFVRDHKKKGKKIENSVSEAEVHTPFYLFAVLYKSCIYVGNVLYIMYSNEHCHPTWSW